MQPVTLPIPASTPARPAPAARPWWKFGMVWLVIAGPAAVVVASFATMVVAFTHADLVLPETPAASVTAPTTPAMLARNHAATPRP
ncbi:MAG TPA: nitrogen fixation protein FixH [Caldimonas sp.]